MTHRRSLSVPAQLNQIGARAQYDAKLRQHRDGARAPDPAARMPSAPQARCAARGQDLPRHAQQGAPQDVQRHLKRGRGLVTALTLEVLMLLTCGT